MGDVPLWVSLGSDFDNLVSLSTKEYPQLSVASKANSTLFANNVSSILPDQSKLNTLIYKRLQDIGKDLLLLSEIKVKTENYMKEAISKFQLFKFQELDDPEFKLVSKLKSELIVSNWNSFLKTNSLSDKIKNFALEVNQTIEILEIFKLFYSATALEIATLVHKRIKKKFFWTPEKKKIPVNWVKIFMCVETVKKIYNKAGSSVSLQLFDPKEISYLKTTKVAPVNSCLFDPKFRIPPQEKKPEAASTTSSSSSNNSTTTSSSASTTTTTTSPPRPRNLDFDLDVYLQTSVPSGSEINYFKTLITDPDLCPNYYSVHTIRGDGNCFFRAVIQSVFHKRNFNLPTDWETILAADLRSNLNRGVQNYKNHALDASVYQWDGFTVNGLNDSLTMQKVGVWADHLQIKKLCNLINGQVEVFTFDDVDLKRAEQGQVEVGEEYVIRKEGVTTRDPSVSLYFEPNPGHYQVIDSEAISQKKKSRKLDVNTILVFLRQELAKKDKEVEGIELFEMLLTFESEVEELKSVQSLVDLVEVQQRSEIEADLMKRVRILKEALMRYWELLASLGEGWFSSMEKKNEGKVQMWKSIELVLRRLVLEEGGSCMWIDGKFEVNGKGPLSKICQDVCKMYPKIMQ
eukprot:TRINITY_DN22528_c0_g1_i1.p1 TRINITY_DN22528_c0_g1~~TRINITY_DN22528_c0_g1_i1.p1  ORF type:complete len:631 (+),score=158.72 TRINITY_DN22528_c0_g1_i1:33-1925(+)